MTFRESKEKKMLKQAGFNTKGSKMKEDDARVYAGLKDDLKRVASLSTIEEKAQLLHELTSEMEGVLRSCEVILAHGQSSLLGHSQADGNCGEQEGPQDGPIHGLIPRIDESLDTVLERQKRCLGRIASLGANITDLIQAMGVSIPKSSSPA